MHRIVVALDLGTIVNQMMVETQVQSAHVCRLTATLYGEITIENGRVEQANFNDYRMLRMAEMPKVECVLAPSGGFVSGCGEQPGGASPIRDGKPSRNPEAIVVSRGVRSLNWMTPKVKTLSAKVHAK